ncbi:MAG: cation:proton antiporter family protein [Planctomycetota bacterium]
MEPIWILIAFLVGLAVRQCGLPPLVGFLCAGFVLSAMGIQATETLVGLADLGIYLLLFSIGLKLDLRSLARPAVWGVASLHMLVFTAIVGAGVFAMTFTGIRLFADLSLWTSLLIAFALSFSSTVFAVKVLEDRAEMKSRHGQEAIGVLITQDLFAIVFLTASMGKMPSPWALLLLGLPLVRRPLKAVFERVGHGELLVLYGLLLVLGAVYVFELVQVKPDLGALVAGLILGAHPKSGELSRALLSLKDLFLVAFFLSIGLQGVPTLEQLGVAAAFLLLLPFKAAMFFWLMTRLKLRARTATLSSLPLTNYSEFGLIVGAVGVSAGWIQPGWLLVAAIAMSLSFIATSPLNAAAHGFFAKYMQPLQRFETTRRLPDDAHIDLGRPVSVVVIAMGRIGTAAYDVVRERFGEGVIGLDQSAEVTERHRAEGRDVICGDATDPDFYARLDAASSCQLAIVALQRTTEAITVTSLLRSSGFTGRIVAMAEFHDEVEKLRDAGADSAHYLHDEMGIGLARSALAEVNFQQPLSAKCA